MKYKKNFFTLLEKIERKKIELDKINIKNLFLKRKNNNQQIMLLVNYRDEYIKKINSKIRVGVCVNQWENYNSFIHILESIIRNNRNLIKENEMVIMESLKKWSKKHIKLKTLEYLNRINNIEILKIKKLQDQIRNNNYIQFRLLKKDNF